jgi:DNA-binding response OmpR family regulator
VLIFTEQFRLSIVHAVCSTPDARVNQASGPHNLELHRAEEVSLHMSPARAAQTLVWAPAQPVTTHHRLFHDGIRLTRKEKALLEMLMENPGRCVTRQALLKSIWNYAEDARTRTVDVHIQRLRRKLGPKADALKTIVRVGYCWLPESA